MNLYIYGSMHDVILLPLHNNEMWILVCGYKRTGKDTLFCILTGLKNDEKYNNYWCVYSRKEFDVSIFQDHSRSDFSRVAFADPLKEYVRMKYHLSADAFDDDKKEKKEIDIGEEGFVSPRDLLIRNSKHQQWHEIATQDKTTSACNFVVTDWRFRCEYEHILKISKPCTVRVFRKDVNVPPENEQSEHELDKTLTDVLLLPKDELETCLELFPQYKDKGFVFRGTIPLRSNKSAPVSRAQVEDQGVEDQPVPAEPVDPEPPHKYPTRTRKPPTRYGD